MQKPMLLKYRYRWQSSPNYESGLVLNTCMFNSPCCINEFLCLLGSQLEVLIPSKLVFDLEYGKTCCILLVYSWLYVSEF